MTAVRPKSLAHTPSQANRVHDLRQVDAPRQPRANGLPAELTPGVEREFRASMRMTKNRNEASREIQTRFAAELGNLAADKEAFHAMMKTCFGKGYDKKTAEQFRHRALAGDFAWLPPIQFVDSATLGGAHGAYNAQNNIVYLDASLRGDAALAAQVYAEECGHFLDGKLNTKDTRGDEGELFRRLLSGETLSKAQIADIRAENDHGVITVDGKEVAVEFWNPFKAIGNAIKKVGHAVGNALKKVGHAVTSVGKAVGNVVTGGFWAVGKAVSGVAQGVGGFFSNLVKGKPIEGFRALGRGIHDGVVGGLTTAVQSAFKSAKTVLDGVTPLFGDKVGGFLNEAGTRVLDMGKSIVKAGVGVVGVGLSLLNTPFEFVGDFKHYTHSGKGFWESLGLAAKTSVGRVVDGVLFAFGGIVSALGTMAGQEDPARPLSAAERAYLQRIYGDSVDWDLVEVKQSDWMTWAGAGQGHRSKVVGNTIYLSPSCYGADGELTHRGMETLFHEMGHIWQYQNGGSDYIHEALLAQITDQTAYDWKKGMAAGVAFEDLNPEQQATVIEEITTNYPHVVQGNGLNVWGDPSDLGPEELAYLRRAFAFVRGGHGAP